MEGLVEVLRETRNQGVQHCQPHPGQGDRGKVEILEAVKRGTIRLGRKYVGGCSDYFGGCSDYFEGRAGGL